MKILIIEDEKKVAENLKKGLSEELFQVDLAATGEEGFFKASSQKYDLILLDIRLPQCDGFEVLKLIRKEQATPVIILTAKHDLKDRIMGFSLGADDYIMKPFAFAELVARIQAILRRRNHQYNLHLKVKDVEMNLLTHAVTKRGKPIDLTTIEFDMLKYFLENKNQLITRQMLSQTIWQEDYSRLLTNIVDVHMAHLRKKLEEGEEKIIHTIRGVGFILKDDSQGKTE